MGLRLSRCNVKVCVLEVCDKFKYGQWQAQEREEDGEFSVNSLKNLPFQILSGRFCKNNLAKFRYILELLNGFNLQTVLKQRGILVLNCFQKRFSGIY